MSKLYNLNKTKKVNFRFKSIQLNLMNMVNLLIKANKNSDQHSTFNQIQRRIIMILKKIKLRNKK
jgi:hypothetical protein